MMRGDATASSRGRQPPSADRTAAFRMIKQLAERPRWGALLPVRSDGKERQVPAGAAINARGVEWLELVDTCRTKRPKTGPSRPLYDPPVSGCSFRQDATTVVRPRADYPTLRDNAAKAAILFLEYRRT